MARSQTLLVTGGAGHVGSDGVAELLDRGHRVVVFDNLLQGHRAAVVKLVLSSTPTPARRAGERDRRPPQSRGGGRGPMRSMGRVEAPRKGTRP